MPLRVLLRHEDPSQIRMAAEVDAEQVEDFPLQPVRRLPDVVDGIDLEPAQRQRHLDAQRAPVLDRPQLIDDFERTAATVVDCRHVRQVIVRLRRLRPQPPQHFERALLPHVHHVLVPGHHHVVQHRIAETGAQRQHRRMRARVRLRRL